MRMLPTKLVACRDTKWKLRRLKEYDSHPRAWVDNHGKVVLRPGLML
jgi:hypothetical protein